MKTRKQGRTFLAGFLAAVLTMALITPAGAALVSKMIQVFTGVTIYVDGEEMQPKDANGNPVETFIYNGTTYVPIRAVSQYFGKTVQWDGSTNTVHIGVAKGEAQYLLDVCPPYQTADCYESPEFITMAGQKYKKGFRFHDGYDNNFALFNLNAQYKTLEFDVGHIDGERMREAVLYIYLDGERAFELELTGDMMPRHCSINLNSALQMKIVLAYPENNFGTSYFYALGNITVK